MGSVVRMVIADNDSGYFRYFSYFVGEAVRMEMSDNTSVNVMKLGDQLYALTETRYINRVDRETLERQEKASLRACHG